MNISTQENLFDPVRKYPYNVEEFLRQFPNESILGFLESSEYAALIPANRNTSKSLEPDDMFIKDSRLLRGEITIPLYSIIFFLAVLGNLLVILTLVQNKRMRTITNVFLLNLSISDLLLAVFCMPFTLVPTLMQNFVFGLTICILIRYMQGVIVGVCVFTLVTISLERYFAICQPLRSRRWQTITHSYRIIALIWAVSLLIMIPTAVCQRIVHLGGPESDRHKCIEQWPDKALEKTYTVILDTLLFVLPMFLMLCAYGRISITLYHGILRALDPKDAHELRHLSNGGDEVVTDEDDQYNVRVTTRKTTTTTATRQHDPIVSYHTSTLPGRICEKKGSFNFVISFGGPSSHSTNGGPLTSHIRGESRHLMNNDDPQRKSSRESQQLERASMSFVSSRSNAHSRSVSNSSRRREELARSVCAKRRSIKMLFAVVLEFFICWTPLYVAQTWYVFDVNSLNERVSATSMNLIHLLAFVSSCSNPITYCFMSRRFRQCFLAAVCGCWACARRKGWGAGSTWEGVPSIRRNGYN